MSYEIPQLYILVHLYYHAPIYFMALCHSSYVIITKYTHQQLYGFALEWFKRERDGVK